MTTTVTFTTAASVSVGSMPASITVGDFNGDGKDDLVVVNSGSSNVSVLLGDGSGSFGSAASVSVGSMPASITVRDFNGDGKDDLVVANSDSDNVSLLLGDGSGSFGSAVNFSVGLIPMSVTVGDFNGDGKDDLVVANSDSDNVSLLLGDGSGSFSSAANFSVGLTPVSVTVRDFNGDGKDDLVVVNSDSDNVSLLLGNGSGSFSTAVNYTVGSNPRSIVVGDFNGDGKEDLAVANGDSGNVSVLLGDGSGSFGTFTNFAVGSSPYFLAVGDFNGDTESDLVTVNKASGNLSVLVNSVGQASTQSINFNEDIFSFKSLSAKVKIKIKIKARRSSLMNEMGCFAVDDDKGTINGIAPGAEGYAEVALERAKVIFSVIGNSPTGFNLEDLSKVLEFDSSTKLRFYMVKNSSTYSVKSKFTSTSEIIFSSVSTQQITTSEDGSFSIGWKDGSRTDSAFDDLLVSVEETDEDPAIGTNLQGNEEGEAIDCRSFGTDTLISGSFTVNREATYNNYVGFYQVSDEKGGIDTDGDGTADILPGEEGYLQAVINSRVSEIGLSVANQGQGNHNGNFKGGAIYVPFLIVDGGIDSLLDSDFGNDPKVYFTFLGANTDKSKHVRMLGDNCFGFEDLAGGGDQDYNDIIVKVDLKVSASFA
jgi:hypothetical protein